MFPNMVRQQPSILCLVKPTRPDKARRLGYKVFSVLTCLYGIQSTRLKELENGMTKDVLLDLIKRGFKSDMRSRKQAGARRANRKRYKTIRSKERLKP